jgi:hypothetical protein
VRKATRATAGAPQPDEIAAGRGALALVEDAAQRQRGDDGSKAFGMMAMRITRAALV